MPLQQFEAPVLRPEACKIDKDEALYLCEYQLYKELGGLYVSANEQVPASGWNKDSGEYGLFIPHGMGDCVTLHVGGITNITRAHHDLVLAGSYIGLHEELRRRRYVLGVTFEPLVRMAVNMAGFGRLEAHGVSDYYFGRLEEQYAMMMLSRRRPMEVGMVYMPTDTFVNNFGLPRLRGDANKLRNFLLGDEN